MHTTLFRTGHQPRRIIGDSTYHLMIWRILTAQPKLHERPVVAHIKKKLARLLLTVPLPRHLNCVLPRYTDLRSFRFDTLYSKRGTVNDMRKFHNLCRIVYRQAK